MIARYSIEQVSAAFNALLDLPETARSAWLETQAIHPDDRLLLVRMLRADSDAEPGFLDESALLHAAAMQSDADREVTPNSLIGRIFGAFRLLAQLGQGGMATVFLAERVGADFEQKVAVKLLRRGLFSSTEQGLFRRERRLLAQLNHPNIARLIDGGVTEAGIPYLVMEFIDGERLDHFVQSRRLDLRARLELFVATCRAVEAAHQALIVHRDIKPSNILVNREGVPKLLDFGIAKLLLDEASGATETLVGALTPGYAAPEQIAGNAVTTAADVYALGVVLHELLTGRRPSQESSAPISTSVSEAHARSFGTQHSVKSVRRMLCGDLENIVSHALASDPQRRYPSATALIEDIESHLQQRPVRAHPPSRWYTLGRFLMRHRVAVALTAVFSSLVLISAGVAIRQAQLARAEAARANSVRDVLVSIFETAETDTPLSQRETPEGIIDIGSHRLLNDAALTPSIRVDLLAVLARVALSLGSSEQAEQLTGVLVEKVESIYDASDAEWLEAKRLRARALIAVDRAGDAVALLAPLREELFARADRPAFMALTTLREAMMHEQRGEQATLDFTIALRKRALQFSDRFPDMVFLAMTSEADFYQGVHRFNDALNTSRAALDYWKAHRLPPTTEVLLAYQSLGNAASSLGDVETGLTAYRDAIRLCEELYARPHENTAWFVGLLGSYLVSLGRLDEAEPYVVRGLALRREITGDDSPETMFAVNALARLRIAQGRQEEALALLDKAIGRCSRVSLDASESCIRLLVTRGRLRASSHLFDDAREDLDRASAIRVGLSGTDSPMLAIQLVWIADLERRRGRHRDAIAAADQALMLMTKGGGGHFSDLAVAHTQRAWSHLDLGFPKQALDEAVAALDELRRHAPDNALLKFPLLAVQARALSRLARAGEAADTAGRALALLPPAGSQDPDVVAELRSILESQGISR